MLIIIIIIKGIAYYYIPLVLLFSIWSVCCTLTQSVSVLSPAVEDYQEARDFDQENQEIREGLERAHKLLKISRKRDYYKILGVSRYGHDEVIKKLAYNCT